MLILVLNTGSSSLKYELFDVSVDKLESIADGLIERIGEAGGDVPDHDGALAQVFAQMERSERTHPQQLCGIGHRVVHGGEAFDAPVLIDELVLDEIRKAIPLAPLHNPAAVAGIEAARRLRPDVPHVAVFDTAFHMTIPAHAHRYALPDWCYERYGVRRYGFHGTSHAYVSRRAAEVLGLPTEQAHLIT